MKVDQSILDQLALYGSSKIKKGKDSGKSGGRRAIASDKPIIEISEESRLVQRVREAIDTMPELRPEIDGIMAEIQEKLDGGTYLDDITGESILKAIKEDLL